MPFKARCHGKWRKENQEIKVVLKLHKELETSLHSQEKTKPNK